MKTMLSQIAGLSSKRLVELAKSDVPRLIQESKYDEATKLGAIYGANYLATQMRDGKPNNDASFVPEVHFYTGKRKLKLAGIVLLQTDEDVKKAVQRVVTRIFKEKKPAAILTISPGFVTKKMKKGQRVSENSYRISAALSILYTKPEQLEFFASFAVGTPQELKHAGFENGPWLLGAAPERAKKVA